MNARQYAGRPARWQDAFAGTGNLVRLILRRERFILPLWVLLIALVGIGIGSSFIGLYSDPAVRQVFASEAAGSPPEVMMLGPVYAPTVGGLVAWRWTLQGILLAGLASLLTVIGHSRAEEESGRQELLGSSPLGRLAPLAAALLVTSAADLLLGLVAAAGLTGLGLPAGGSLALGLSVAAGAFTVGALAGVVAQFTQGAGAARGLTGLLFALLYLLRAGGDTAGTNGPAWLSWLSPLGWARLMQPYAGERWWILGLFFILDAMLVLLAFALVARRDLGAGLLKPRSGPATAPASLRNPLALAWRLQRGGLFGWSAGFAFIGLLFGFIARTVTSQLSANPAVMSVFSQMGGRSGPSDAVFTLFLMTFGEVFAAYAILATLHLQAEESSGHAELLLAAPVERLRWMGGHLVFAVLNPAIVVALFGVTAGLTYGLSAPDPATQLLRITWAALAYLPAVWVLSGVTATLFGFFPRRAGLAYAVLVVFLLIDLGSELRQIASTVAGLSPFAHVPRLLLGEAISAAWFGLVVMAATLIALGLWGFLHRDVG